MTTNLDQASGDVLVVEHAVADGAVGHQYISEPSGSLLRLDEHQVLGLAGVGGIALGVVRRVRRRARAAVVLVVLSVGSSSLGWLVRLIVVVVVMVVVVMAVALVVLNAMRERLSEGRQPSRTGG